MKPTSVTASRRPPWQNPTRRRQVATGAGVLLLGCLVLVVLAVEGRGPHPANPEAGLEPGRPTQNVPAAPRTTTPSAGTSPTTAEPTQLPTATKPGEIRPLAGLTTTSHPMLTQGTPTPEIVETTAPRTPGVTEKPPTIPTPPPTNRTTVPTTAPTKPPTTVPPATPPPTSTTPTAPPTTPNDPHHPGLLGGLLGGLLDKLGL